MASRTDDSNRTVIPNWNDFKTTSKSGELLGNAKQLKPENLFDISQYIHAWNFNHSLAFAGDLLSAAIMNEQTDNPSVLEAATFITEREDICPESLLRTAMTITRPILQTESFVSKNKENKLDEILNRENVIKERIRFLRKLIYRFQYNPIWYVELARAYATLGLLEKASSAMAVAVHLSPESRFVTRCASRLYVHMGDLDKAHYVITHNPTLKGDPWLLASEIAINSSRGRSSRFIKDGLSIINSDNFSPFSITELSSAIGTKELESSRKKGKNLIAISLVQPNDNSLSQADWLMNMDNSLALDFSRIIKPEINFESDARFAFLREDYELAFNCSIDWVDSAPFAKSSINFAAEMAYTFQRKYQDAIKILRIGLKCNPKDHAFLNNLAYAYALNDQTDKADEILLQLKPMVANDTESRICATATEGLIEYRKGNQEVGSLLYLSAIEEAKNTGNISLAHKAILNNIREEVRIEPHQERQHIIDMMKSLNTGNSQETRAMKDDILSYIV